MENTLLSQRLKEIFALLEISPEQQSSLKTYCELMRLKDEATYCHCVRVALYGVEVAELLHLDKKALFYSGLLHDIGKVMINKELLVKTGYFSKADQRKIKKHSLYGYYLLKGVYDFSAEIILRHHRYGGYPKKLPRSKARSQDDKMLIEYYAKILAIVDFYDAASTRKNERFQGKEVKTLLIQHFPNEIDIINLCYEKAVFDL